MKTKFSEVKSVRGKMINTLLKPYLLSLVFEVPDINRIKTELKNLMESNFKFDIYQLVELQLIKICCLEIFISMMMVKQKV